MSKKKVIPLPSLKKGVNLVDTHCHLEMLGSETEIQEAINRAFQADVTTIITIGIDLETSRQAVQLAADNTGVYASVGIHPHHAEDVSTETLDQLKILAKSDRVVAYGEIGLDAVKNYAPFKVQQQAFISQLQLARELNLPVIIHDREAHEHIYSLLKEYGPFPAGGVIHCFSGDWIMAHKCIDLGFFISIPGVVTFKKANMLQDAVRQIPLNKLLIETDAPFLAPVPRRGKKNEPVYTLYTAQKVAELKGIDIDEVARRTTENVKELFGIDI